MNNRLYSFVVLFLLMYAGLSCSSVKAQGNQYSKANSIIVVNNVVSAKTITLGKNSTLKFQGGKFSNCHIQGNNTTVICSGEKVVFDNCTFSGTFINSTLKATNFGCKPDMTSRNIVWKSNDGKKVNTKQRQGSNNKKALESIAQFCSSSSKISLNFNGAFFTPVVDNLPNRSEGTGNFLTIKEADALTLRGGTLIQGFYLVNCSNVHLTDISFVGFHEVHDFPTLYYQKSSFTNTKGAFYQSIKKGGFTTKNTANIVNNQYQALGIAGANTIQLVTEKGGLSQNILIENCNFEMRTAGICVGHNKMKCDVRNVVIRNCEFSHMYFQPLGFTGAARVTVDSIRSDYCLQGVDVDRWVSHLTVKNSTFLNCYVGPKLEPTLKSTSDTENSFDYCFDNCYFQINERIKYVDLNHYLFLTGQTADYDKFVIKNSTFDVRCNSMQVGGFISRHSQLELDNITVNLDCSTNQENYDVPRLFNTAGTILFEANYVPKINLNNVRFNINGTRIGYIASPAGAKYELNLNNVTMAGNATCVYPAFSSLSKLTMTGTVLDIEFKNSLIEKIPTVILNNITCQAIKDMVYNNGALNEDLSVSIRNSNITSKGRFLNFVQAQKANVDVQSNVISCSSIVHFADDPKNLSLNITGNDATVTGNEVFTGVANAKKTFVPSCVSVTRNTFKAKTNISLYGNGASSSARKVFSNSSNSIVQIP